MRLFRFVFIVLALAGIAAAQDTNFPQGPQYLITTDSPLFLRSIATPSLSLNGPAESLVPAPGGSVESQPAPPNLPTGVSPADLTRIYWGPPPEEQASSSPSSPTSSEIEITSPQRPLALPASMVEVGVTSIVDAQTLRTRGYGNSLGEVAAFYKTNPVHATRVFTNADVARLHGG